MSEIPHCVHYTSAESRQKVLNGAENRITFAPAKRKSLRMRTGKRRESKEKKLCNINKNLNVK